MIKIAVIGGGASGMMAAGLAASNGINVTMFEKNNRLGKKLRITGKGRCNVTNSCNMNTFLENVPTNPKFLYSAFSAFPPEAVMSFFEGLGVPLKVERGNRVFPVSDKAEDIVSALSKFCDSNNVRILYSQVNDIEKLPDGQFEVKTEKGIFKFDKIIIATGGVSYPQTGSDGDGYKFAKKAGHKIKPLSPSLVPLECYEKYCAQMMGLSLKNVTLKVTDKKTQKTVFEEMGEMLFCHFGVSGPLVLSASAKMKPMEKDRYEIAIDLKPALDEKTLDARILSDFSKNINKNFSNSMSALLPQKMIEPFIKLCGIDMYKKVNLITKDERKNIVRLLKAFPLSVKGTRSVDEAIITCGGVDVSEINPKTMQSKLTSGLYFAGEVIDCDAYTGGFNLQIAFSTAYIAANSIND